ncbi:MAG TPA: YerC/YecD family TrpR-related protein [Candidatus Limnocylindrales bacterium]|nr:YerC/YecD family TrpR-related protein [Candidatus Limnocylindrales bacterium]
MAWNEMTMASDDSWQTQEMRELFEAILALESSDDAAAFFRDLCTLGELRDMAQRWAVVGMLDAGLHYAEISQRTGASTATVTRIASWLHHGQGGYRTALDRLAATSAAPTAGSRPYPTRPER